ncbi:MAG: type restriction enzyme [Acidobacteriota bacterium]|nr:type restriction enzyme [Acidobacteriota bacterium]
MESVNNRPFEILSPYDRWWPTRDQLNQSDYEKLLPPLVHKIREAVANWRDSDYAGVSTTSKALLKFWFASPHKVNDCPFRFFFSQQEAIESIIYLYEKAGATDKYQLMKFDSSGRISTGMFMENWPRYVIKMATGSGKTKVMALALVWSYFHKLYEPNSSLSKNFLIIAPNIIVLNRLLKDFGNFRIFREEPFIPDNGFADKNWKNDFQVTLHIQDDIKPITGAGNLFLTNIHRVYFQEDDELTVEEEFLGPKPKPDADTSRGLDLGKILRGGKLQDLVVMNDEAHHIHDPNMQWFKSIEEINDKLKLKYGGGLAIQVDFTATPRHSKGEIFVQTICDYPLVEAIRHGVVKSPVLPDEASRNKLTERASDDFTERYRDYIHLGYLEWKQQFDDLHKSKIPVLFIMTTDTREADQVSQFIQAQYPELKDKVLTIHTNNSGEIKESAASKRDKEELEQLRKAADDIDSDLSPYRAVVSVLMLREGWDVRNVTTIVGLRPYKSPAKILPEQTLGRGLRKMFAMGLKEELVVVGTSAFIEFVEELKTEGVNFEYRPMGQAGAAKNPLIVEVDRDNPQKNINGLDIEIPVLSPRIYRDYKSLELIDVAKMEIQPLKYNTYSEDELKEIVFKDIDGEVSHTTIFNGVLPDYKNVLAFFTRNILKESRLVSGFDVLYPRVQEFIEQKLYGKTISLDSPQTIRNLSEMEATRAIYNAFKKAIDELTVSDKGTAEIRNYICLLNTKPVVMDNREFMRPKKSIFNKIVADNKYELQFANFLDNCPEVISFAKNHSGIYFKIEYQGEDNNIHEYFPDFFVKTEKSIFIIETKGREDVNDPRKIERLRQWCADVNALNPEKKFIPLYVKQEDFEKERGHLKTFKDVQAIGKIKS